ncbi:MAG: hypothetical protein KME60_11995 [Cyanomargarita calcarea GSE-NOS-MK-12-04C]|uniref:Uncharacterized protein n=1 Tax=Cyanomargarita calcarea GSE-NOS-MK-12-04C TaxID=2839659 RepID=A0A951USN8_9CYAN|nr:hypothetical protein [Cyanomargarita calcarea GSE-NOS-MK-12-04C]
MAKERGIKTTTKMTKDAIIEALKLSEKNSNLVQNFAN